MVTKSPLAFDEAGISLIAEIIEAALGDAKLHNIHLPADDRQARMLLGRRIIQAIEAGETDMQELRQIALLSRFDAQAA